MPEETQTQVYKSGEGIYSSSSNSTIYSLQTLDAPHLPCLYNNNNHYTFLINFEHKINGFI